MKKVHKIEVLTNLLLIYDAWGETFAVSVKLTSSRVNDKQNKNPRKLYLLTLACGI